jgi:outer membrane protein assembly factor BamB
MTNHSINRQSLLLVVRGAFWASAAFCAVLAVLLCATAIQVQLHQPLNSPALARMYEQAKKDPGNAEQAIELRAFDLLARKAYFTSTWQIRMGGILLMAGLAAVILLWKAYEALAPRGPTLRAEKSGQWWIRQGLSRTVLASAGLAVIIMAGGSIFLTQSKLSVGHEARQEPPALSYEQLRTGWPGFRGPGGNAIAYYKKAPISWDGATMKGIRWKTEIPRQGNSSPVVWDNRVFLTGGDETAREVFCFSLQNGKLLWRHQVKAPGNANAAKPTLGPETGYAAPTVACDGQRIFAIFATGELVCLSLDGHKVWSRNLGVPDNHYGHSSSLITYEDNLYVQFDHAEGKLFALRATTGEPIWEVKRNTLSWASPICVFTGTRQELVLVDNEKATSYDPRSGSPLWSHNCMYGEVGPSPAYAAGVVYVTTETSPVAAIKTVDDDSSKILWRWDGDLPNTASPVATDSFVFFATAGGTVSCVSTDSGKTVWTHDFEEGFYSSPVVSGSRVFLMDRTGAMRIFEAFGIYREIGSPKLGEPSVATPAFLDGLLIIRGEKHLYCVQGDANG